jgi:hypothetical protein
MESKSKLTITVKCIKITGKARVITGLFRLFRRFTIKIDETK